MQYTSLQPFSTLINESMKEDIRNNIDEQLLDIITTVLLYFKDYAKQYDLLITQGICDPDITIEFDDYQPSNRKHAENVDIVYKLLFTSPISSLCINSMYHILGSKLLRYEDDDYCDYINDKSNDIDDDYITRLILIVNALINKNIFN